MNFRDQIFFCFISDVLGMIDSRKKIGGESSFKVHKMLGCLKCNY